MLCKNSKKIKWEFLFASVTIICSNAEGENIKLLLYW